MPSRRTDPEDFAEYQGWLAQVDLWPRRGEESVSIWGMNPSHAISAYRKLLRWADLRGNAESVPRTPLAMALLQQAVGSMVVYAADLPPAPLGDLAHPLSGVTLEAAYDALVALQRATDAAGKPLHILNRARILRDALTNPKEETTHGG